MASIIWDVSVSLDGFTTGPNVSRQAPMGAGGEALHAWMRGEGPHGAIDRAALETANAGLGASIVGRHTFDLALDLWGGTPWAGIDCFVVTHRLRPDFVDDNGGQFHFTPLDTAARQARQRAGAGTIPVLGANTARQLLRAGQIDRIRLHTVPILLGSGTPLFVGETARLVPFGDPLFGEAVHQLFEVQAR